MSALDLYKIGAHTNYRQVNFHHVDEMSRYILDKRENQSRAFLYCNKNQYEKSRVVSIVSIDYNLCMIRTRIAPSPTGFPHIGTIYQAYFDFVFAKKYDGQFIVRIEDTDQNRFVEGAEDVIYQSFDWFGIEEDESTRKGGPHKPYRQSERLDMYQKYAQQLVDQKDAYVCFCTKERLTKVRAEMQNQKKIPKYDRHCRSLDSKEIANRKASNEPFVIRMKIPDGEEIVVTDGIRGEIVFQSDILDDQVIVKSDGFPTYHLAVVVDDHEMKITHVLRGEEWISSAPKHILLYQYLGWKPPLFFHTPLIRNPDKSKLSKRQGHTSVSWYQEEGYLPEAILNYLALMGWTHPDEKELFTTQEFIRHFEFKDLKPLGPVFEIKKLQWMNGQYIMKMSNDELRIAILDFYKDRSLDKRIVESSTPLIKERIKTLKEYWEIAGFLFEPPEEYEKDLSSEREILSEIISTLESIQNWSANTIGDTMQDLASQKNISFGKFFMVLRIALSGKKITPPLNESMELLGKHECIARIQAIL